ncbi:MAG: nucleotidyltransferase domain-containing protein [Pseudomonadota bacterium]
MNADEELVTKVIKKILTVADPERIILFGSAATGTQTFDSDLDLLVIKRGIIDHRHENVRLRSALAELGVPVDIFTMTPERFAETKDVFGGLAYPANKYGRVIYEAA